MICPKCQTKMKCTYTVPTTDRSRYRVHRCPSCRDFFETVELPIDQLTSPEAHALLLQKVRKAQFNRMAFIVMHKRTSAH